MSTIFTRFHRRGSLGGSLAAMVARWLHADQTTGVVLFGRGGIVALDLDTPRFTNEDALKADVIPPRGGGPHTLRALSGQAIRESVKRQIRRQSKDHAAPAWAVEHRSPEDRTPDYYEQLVSETIPTDLWASILGRCLRGEALHIFIKVESEPSYGKLVIDPPIALPAGHPDIKQLVSERTAEEEREPKVDSIGFASGQAEGRRIKIHTFDVGPAVSALVTKLKKLIGEV